MLVWWLTVPVGRAGAGRRGLLTCLLTPIHPYTARARGRWQDGAELCAPAARPARSRLAGTQSCESERARRRAPSGGRARRLPPVRGRAASGPVSCGVFEREWPSARVGDTRWAPAAGQEGKSAC